MRREITSAQQRELADLNVTIEEGLSISGIQLAKSMGAGPTLVRRFTESSARLIDLELRSSLAGRWRMASMSVLFAAIPAVIYLSAGLPMTRGTMTIGTLIAFTALQGQLFRPLMGLLNTGVQVVSSLALFQRVFEYLDLPVDIDEPTDPVDLDPAAVRGHVRFEHVGFSYDDAEVPALSDVDLDVPAGTTLALVGETGSGKTTLGSLVARLHDPTSGAVTIDGIDVRRIRLADLAEIVGIVSQETYLLHTTVRENLRYARPDATDAELVAAARAARIHDLIASLPDGYDTVVGSRGHRFSGGEKQRIAIARTLLRNPRVLVLDEATSALDTETERAVQEAFDTLSEGRTTITIAHRLSTVRDADQIVVLDHGRVIERGTHEALLEEEGRYAALGQARPAAAQPTNPSCPSSSPADRHPGQARPAVSQHPGRPHDAVCPHAPVGTRDRRGPGLSEALEAVEVCRGHLYAFHRRSGHRRPDPRRGGRPAAQGGHEELADRIDTELVGRNVIHGRWTFQIVEEYDDTYWTPFRELEREARDQLVDGKRHLYEAEMKERERTAGDPHHTAVPDDSGPQGAG